MTNFVGCDSRILCATTFHRNSSDWHPQMNRWSHLMPVVTILKWFCYNVPGTRGNCDVKLFLTSNERDDLHLGCFLSIGSHASQANVFQQCRRNSVPLSAYECVSCNRGDFHTCLQLRISTECCSASLPRRR
jgi:hypothetical protein